MNRYVLRIVAVFITGLLVQNFSLATSIFSLSFSYKNHESIFNSEAVSPPSVETHLPLDLKEEITQIQWTQEVLKAEENLYQLTIDAIQHRLRRYGSEIGRVFTTTSDLLRKIEFKNGSEQIDYAPIDRELSSFPLRVGLNPMTDLEVPKIDYEFSREQISIADQKEVIGMLLRGEMLHQLLMAGEASRLKKDFIEKGIHVTDDELAAMYFLDIGFLNGQARRLPWGPRQILQIRYLIEKLAIENPEFGITPAQAVKNQMLLIHTNEKTDTKIAHDFVVHHFYGFAQEHVVFVAQHVDHPFDFVDGKLVPAVGVEKVALGHGWASLEAAMENRAYRMLNNSREPLHEDAYNFFIQRGNKIFHQYRVNDLYNISEEAIDIPYLAAEWVHIRNGETAYVARMVANPSGSKGGIPLSVRRSDWNGASLIIADTLSASDWRMKLFLDRLETKAPYHRFANTGDLQKVREALRHDGILPDFELKMFKESLPGGKIQERYFINPQFVTGMIVTIRALAAKTAHLVGQEIKDFKDLKTLPLGWLFWQAQESQSGFNLLLQAA